METNISLLLTHEYFSGDSLIQLRDGRILSYYFRDSDLISVYNPKTFKKYSSIEFYEIKFENIKRKVKNIDEKKQKYEEFILYDKIYKEFKGCPFVIKQLKNNYILVGCGAFLFEIFLQEKNYDCKIVYNSEDIILNINQLSDNRIILTKNDVKIIFKQDDKYISKCTYLIEEKWKIIAVSSIYRFYGDFHQYFLTYEIPKERLLLKSFSTEKSYNGGCGTHPPSEFSHSKLIFINLKEFKEIKSTEVIYRDTNILVYEKIIVTKSDKLYFYDINTLDIIKEIEINNNSFNYIFKYNKIIFIGVSLHERLNNLYIFKIGENYEVKKYIAKNKLIFDRISYYNHYEVHGYNNKKC